VVLEYPRGQAPAGAGPVSVKLDYGQPHLRGRTLHTDSLVPYGRPWRTGANAPTTLTTGVDLVIGGQPVPRGNYVVWTIPAQGDWQLVLQRPVAAGAMQQAMQFDPAHDVARITLTRSTLAVPLESLTMWLVPSTAPAMSGGELRIAWGTTSLSTSWMVR